MKLLHLVLASSGAAAFSPQQVLQAPHNTFDAWTKPLGDLHSSLKSLSHEARAVWDEVASLFPKEVARTTFLSPPKKHTRRPASHWDSIIKGADVQAIWTQNKDGEMERDVDGKLAPYTLKSRAVDPSVLGVDPDVKQISGYLDDDENDKHLFYWFFESRGNPETDPVSPNTKLCPNGALTHPRLSCGSVAVLAVLPWPAFSSNSAQLASMKKSK